MKVITLYCLFFFSAIATLSQSQSWSEPVKANMDDLQITVAGTDVDGFFVVEQNTKQKSLKLIRYKLNDMKPAWSEIISMPSGTLDQQFESLVHLGDKFLLFTSAFSARSEQFQVFCTIIDANGKKTSEAVLVHYALCRNRETAPMFGYTLSPDKSKVLLYLDPPDEKKMTDAISFKMYDTSLELLTEKELLLPYTAEIVQVHSFLMDNEGNIYMMSGCNYDLKTHQLKRPAGNRYAVFFYSYKDNRLKEYDVSLKDKLVVSLSFTMNANFDVVLAGYYANDSQLAAIGTFLFTIGANGGAVKAATFMPFGKDFVARFKRESETTNDATLTDFYIRNMLVGTDGSLILIGEQIYNSQVMNNDEASGKQTMAFRHNFDDLIATRIEANGRQSWNVKIPKRQVANAATNFCSFNCFDLGDNIYITFNDHVANAQKLKALAEGEATEWSTGANTATTLVTLSRSGTFTRAILTDEKIAGYEQNVAITSSNGEKLPVLGYSDSKGYKFCLLK